MVRISNSLHLEKRSFLARSFLRLFIALFLLIITSTSCTSEMISNTNGHADSEYAKIQDELASGWNTWNTNSVLSHVLLPEGLSINMILKNEKTGKYLKNALVGKRSEKIKLLAHTPDGTYTELGFMKLIENNMACAPW